MIYECVIISFLDGVKQYNTHYIIEHCFAVDYWVQAWLFFKIYLRNRRDHIAGAKNGANAQYLEKFDVQRNILLCLGIPLHQEAVLIGEVDHHGVAAEAEHGAHEAQLQDRADITKELLAPHVVPRRENDQRQD